MKRDFLLFTSREPTEDARTEAELEYLTAMNTPTIRPMSNNVLIRPAKAKDKTDGGLFIPDNAKTEQQRGVVIACGPLATGVKPNEKVIYGKFAGTPLIVGGDELLMLGEDAIVAVIEGE